MTDEPDQDDDDEPTERVVGAFDPETRTIYIAPVDPDDEQEDDDE